MEKENDIDSLARMFANGFSSMEVRFETLENSLGQRMDNLEQEVRTTNGRISTLEHEVRITNQRIDSVIVPDLDDHARRIKDLELKVG